MIYTLLKIFFFWISLPAILIFFKKRSSYILLKKISKLRNSSIFRHFYKKLPLIIIAIAFSFYSYINISAFHSLNWFDRDFCSYSQILWKLSQGIKPFTTIFHLHFLGDHWSPILIPISLIYKILPSPLSIIILNLTIFFIGAYTLYLISNILLKSRLLSLSILITIIFNPYTFQALNLYLNPDIYSFCLISLAFYSLLKSNHKLYFLAYFLALNCKEDISLYFVAIGIWIAFSLKKSKIGITTTVFSILWLIFINKVAMPHFSTSTELFNYGSSYSKFGTSLYEIVKTCLTHPNTVIPLIFSLKSITSIIFTIFCYLPFFILGFLDFLPVTLPIIVKVLSCKWEMAYFSKYHIWHPLFFIVFTSILGLAKAQKIITKKTKINIQNINIILAITLISAVLFNILFISKNLIPYINTTYIPLSYNLSKERTSIKKEALSHIPKHANLFADTEFLSYSPNRNIIYEINPHHKKRYPEALDDVDYCIFDFKLLYRTPAIRKAKSIIWLHLNQKENWEILYSKDGIEVYKRHKKDET